MAVVSPDRESASPSTPSAAGAVAVPRRAGRRWLLAALLAVLAVVGVGRARDLLPSLPDPFASDRVDRTQPAVLKAIEDLREYRAATGNFEVIVDLERDARYLPAVLKGERTLFVAAGSMDAGVDFSRLGSDAVSVSPDRRRVTVSLPHARLFPARLDLSRSYVFEQQRGLVDRLATVFSENPTDQREVYLLAERRLAAAGEESGLVGRAEENTRLMLQGLLRSAGFAEVSVHFG